LVVAMKEVRSLSRSRGPLAQAFAVADVGGPRATSHVIRPRFKGSSAQAETLCDLQYAIRFVSSAQ